MKLTLTPLLLALSLSFPVGSVLAQAAAPASAASGPAAIIVRKEIATALPEVIELHKNGKLAEALARLDQAIAASPNPTPAEAGVLQRTRGLLALQLGQNAEAVTSLQAALASKTLLPADELLMAEALVRAHFNAKNYPATLEWIAKATAQGSRWSGLPSLRTKALYLSNDYAGAAKDIEARLQASPATPPSEEDLRLLASAYGQIKDQPSYQRTLEKLMQAYPRPEYWPDMLSRVPRGAGWQARYDIDLYRLRLKVGAMREAADYVELAELANKAGLPAEGLSVLDNGLAKGVLGNGGAASEHQKLRATTAKLAEDDRKNLALPPPKPVPVTDARSASNVLTTGAALVSVGLHERGLALMQSVVNGPHLADPALGRLEYGIALQAAGKTAEAVEVFRALGNHESLGLLARLWVIALVTPKS